MYNIDQLRVKLFELENQSNSYNKIFTHSKYENAKKPHVNESVTSLINENLDQTFTGIDLCCGHGFMLQSLSCIYKNSTLIGIDIDKFESWDNDVENLSFYSIDMFELIQMKLNFKFDVIFTFNTLRGTIEQWGHENYINFLAWCNMHSKFLITNNCTTKKIPGFELVNTIKIENDYDTNLFKSLNVI